MLIVIFPIVISRGEDQPVPNDDLDRLQMELEFMLSAIATQNRLLHSQVEVINAAEESKPKKPAHLIIPKAVSLLLFTHYF